MPIIVHMSQSLTIPHFPESTLPVNGSARVIFANDLRLQRPVHLFFRYPDQFPQEFASDFPALGLGTDIDADLSDSGCPSVIRNRCQCRPANSFGLQARHHAAELKVPLIPLAP